MGKITHNRVFESRLASKSVVPPVPYALFSKSIENLPDIAFQIQCHQRELGVNKSLDECATWYYEQFYANPGVRQQYEFKLSASTLQFKEKILKLPIAATETCVSPARRISEGCNEPLKKDAVTISVDNCGTFVFPVSFSTFIKYLDQNKLIRQEVNNKENREILSTDRNACRQYLKEYYNKFYILPNGRPDNLHFKKVSPDVLSKLLRRASPVDKEAISTMAKKPIRGQLEDTEERIQSEDTSSIVSFAVFERHVKNLYNIVWRLKLFDPDYASKGFEDCAEAFYMAFYKTPEIREKYPIELKDCTSVLREKIFAIPKREEANELEKQFHRDECTANMSESKLNNNPRINSTNNCTPVCSVEVDVGNHGRFLFPVSIDVFRSHINYEDIILPLLKFNTKKDDSQETRTKAFKRYYNFFYVFADKRDLVQYKFPYASEKMLEVLLSVGQPLDEKAKKTMGGKCLTRRKPLEAPLPPVTFKQFQKCIRNMDEIVQQMMECGDFKHLPKARENIEKEYYKLFYSSPQIRKRFTFKLGPCPAAMKKRLLAFRPTEANSQEQDNTNTSNNNSISKRKEALISNEAENVINFPVTFKTFKRYIENLSDIVQEMQFCDKYKGKTEDECFHEYYKEFYSSVNVRKKFEYKLKPCPLKMKQKLLSFSVLTPAQVISSTVDRCKNERDTILKVKNQGRFKLPVSFETFKTYINYDEISGDLLSQLTTNESLLPNLENPKWLKIFRRYYNSFYVFPEIRKKFSYKFICQEKELLQKLLSYAQPLDDMAKQTLTKAIACETKEAESSVQPENDTVHAETELENNSMPVLREEIPKPAVTFKTFIGLMHLDEVLNRMQSSPEHAKLSREECAMAFYHAFFFKSSIRDKCSSLIKPCPAKLKSKLLSKPQSKITAKINTGEDTENVDTRRKVIFGIYNETPASSKKDALSMTNAINVQPCEVENITESMTSGGCETSSKTLNLSVSQLTTPDTTLKVITAAITSPAKKSEVTSSTLSNTEESAGEALTLPSKNTPSVALNAPASPQISQKQTKSGHSGISETITSKIVVKNTPAMVNLTNTTDRRESAESALTLPSQNSVTPNAQRSPQISQKQKKSGPDGISETSVSGVVDNNIKVQDSTVTSVTVTNTTSETNVGTMPSLNITSPEEDDAERTFFATNCTEHNIRNLLCTSHGIQKTIWRILSQLSLTEFKTYTKIHNGSSFYENESMLSRCYAHTLLSNKGVQQKDLELSDLSPKIFHWKILMLYTNFDEIVELLYWQRTKETIDNVETLWKERFLLYVMCWQHNRWIQKVPKITDRRCIESLASSEITQQQVVPYKNPLIVEHDVSANESHTIQEQLNSSMSICPPTQLNLSNFVDVGLETSSTQQQETQNDPLLEHSITVPNEQTKSSSPQVIKQEKITYLNHLRFTFNSNSGNGSGDFECETISSDDSIIVLDNEEDDVILEKLKCFDMQQEEDISPLVSHILSGDCYEEEITTQIEEEIVAEASESLIIDARPTTKNPNEGVDDGVNLLPQGAIPDKKIDNKRKPTGGDKTTSKKRRLMTDFVPQVAHAFRALPLNAMVRVELEEPVASVHKESQQLPLQVIPQVSASQAFAMDDTLFKSSQLNNLLDPVVALSKVNDNAISANRALLKPAPLLSKTIVYRQLKSYVFIRSLSNSEVRDYRIDSLAVGQPYQRACIQVMGKTYYLNGPLLQTLFPHTTSTLLVDLKFLFWAVEKFNWESRDLCAERNNDLRTRVLSMFIDVAPNFGHFRLKYVNETQEWASCSLISIQDPEFEERQPVFDIVKSIKPQILDNLKQLVNSL